MSTGPLGQQGSGGCEGSDGPLAGLTVVDLSTTVAGLFATQFLADAGAEVVGVEPPGGSPLRARAGWPALARGRRSIVLDLKAEADVGALRGLVAGADVLVTTMRPGTAERLGLGPRALAELNPRLVSAAITGFGSTGPWRDLKGYEALVMAKLGMLGVKKYMVARPGPAFISTPFASWGAAHTAVHGILSALLEREDSGLGQHVEADLVRGVAAIDTWSWYTEMIGIRWPGAYEVVEAYTPEGDPLSPMTYALLAAPTKDGTWLQFAQNEPRLFVALMEELGLAGMLSDPAWKGIPVLESQEQRSELWEIMVRKVGERTLQEWQHTFDTNPNVNAEEYRSGPQALDHPQLLHDGRVTVVEDPDRGPVRQPSTLVHVAGGPLSVPRPAPALDADGALLRAAAAPAAEPAPAPAGDPAAGLPLAGVTVLDFGVMFAGPFGATLLAELGARVIKVESLTGDSLRHLLPFPEAGATKAMQGKESISLDLKSDDGRRIVHELARRSDVVLQAFRAGAAERAGVDEATLKALNPDLVYINAPGYGVDGPYGHRPAYAPSIGAAAGVALTDAPHAAAQTGSVAQIQQAAVGLYAAAARPTLQADGLSALAVASAMLLGLLARARHRPLGALTTTMLATTTHVLVDQVVDHPNRPATPTVDKDGHGIGALYRSYETAEGWIFLAAPAEKEWPRLVSALAEHVALDEDARFGGSSTRAAHDEELAAVLAEVFAKRSAREWERRLTAADIGCATVAETLPEILLQTDPALVAEYTTTAVSAVFDEHLRMGPTVRFSRSRTRAEGSGLAGDHTASVLRELRYGDDAVDGLRKRGVIN